MASVRVLVIDDEEMIRWSFERALGAAGYVVTAAETAAEGLARFRTVSPDVVFLDIRLPDANGLSVLEIIRREAGTNTAIIVMTAFGETYPESEAIRLGAMDYLKKPFDFETLDSLVRKALPSRLSHINQPPVTG